MQETGGSGCSFSTGCGSLGFEDAFQSKVIKARWWLRLPAGPRYRPAPDTRDGRRCISGFPHHSSSPAAFCKRGKPECRGGLGESCGDCKAKSGFELASVQPIVDQFPDCRPSSGSSRIRDGAAPVEGPKATPTGMLVWQKTVTASKDDNLCHF